MFTRAPDGAPPVAPLAWTHVPAPPPPTYVPPPPPVYAPAAYVPAAPPAYPPVPATIYQQAPPVPYGRGGGRRRSGG